MGAEDKEPTGGVAAVDRALGLLAAFDAAHPALTLTELAARAGLYKSTALRLARSLERAGLVLRTADGRFRLGAGILRLATVYRQGHAAPELILPQMRRLADSLGESVGFYVPEGEGQRVCLYRINAERPVSYNIRQGDAVPLPLGSAGRVIVAFGGAEGAGYDAIRAAHLCFTEGERLAELSSLSAPVFGPDGLIGALTVGGPRSRVDGAFRDRAAPELLGAALRASQAAGGETAGLAAALAGWDGGS